MVTQFPPLESNYPLLYELAPSHRTFWGEQNVLDLGSW